jgi:PAT family beta-lactamase induction signal transducer AmpG
MTPRRAVAGASSRESIRAMINPEGRLSRFRSGTRALAFALSSRRTLAVTLLSFSSGLPLGLVWIAIPDWMRNSGFDIRVVGLTTLAHAPWTFKMIWSPLMDRYPLPWLGRRRGWIVVSQIGLSVLTLLLAGVGHQPDGPWIILAVSLAIAFASASQDIVIDAYTVDVLRREEHGVAVGARTALYRVAMQVVGGLSITVASWISWPAVFVGFALLYLPMIVVTRGAPEPEDSPIPPRTVRQAVWLPFLGFLSRHRALEILAFVLLYKLADNLAQSLQRPFLIDMGYSDFDRGAGLVAVGLTCTLLGTLIGGASTTLIGLGHALWIFGLLQIFSNLGFVFVSRSDVNHPLMYGAMGFEALTTGLGMGAFGVLLLRITQKRFSATQYALFSSLFGLPRMLAGPVTGVTVHALGWTTFFWLTMAAGVPGLLMLARFVPPGTREPTFTVEPPRHRRPLSVTALALRGVASGLLSAAFALLLAVLLLAADAAGAGEPFDVAGEAAKLFPPVSIRAVLTWLGALVVGAACGLLVAAVSAARRGAGLDEKDLPGTA